MILLKLLVYELKLKYSESPTLGRLVQKERFTFPPILRIVIVAVKFTIAWLVTNILLNTGLLFKKRGRLQAGNIFV